MKPEETRRSLASIFDKRLLWTMGLLGVVGFVACDGVNSALNKAFADPALPGPVPASWKPGTTHNVEITLITKDYSRLDCASDEERDGRRCKYKANKVLWPKAADAPTDTNNELIIQPYRTAIGNHYLVVSGLWATPAVALRVHQEPFVGVADKKLKRFVADCKVRFVEPLSDHEVRWGTTQSWVKEKTVPAGIAEDCKIVR